jgi:hypothetical protein
LQERQVAKEVSEARLHADRLLTKSSAPADRSYLTKMELLTDKGSEARNALVQHYRYKDDTTILTTVDLATKAVVRTEQVPHLSTPLSQEELNEAIRLASADPAVAGLLKPHANPAPQVEALVSRASTKDDPEYGHRVVHLLYRGGRGYLYARAVVDLTTSKVRLVIPQPRPGARQD